MKILFEGYQYKTEDVKDALQGLLSDNDLNQPSQQLKYVGYYYNKNTVNTNGTKGDMVFILPKVLLDDGKTAFGCDPTTLIDFNLKAWKIKNKKVHDFIYGFSSWLYSAIDIYRKNQSKKSKNDGEDEVKVRSSLEIGKGGQERDVTYYDIQRSLVDFQKKHHNFITFVIKMSHSGFNKISWPKTIAQTQALVQDESPIYLNPINKQRVINFDEELLIIYFSILNYLNEYYGIPISPNQPGYKLITGAKFDSYLKGQGSARLHKIRYKYYSDEAILLWNLCNNFFEKYNNLRTQPNEGDYLLVNKFEAVFEEMIDELIGDKDLPKGLKVQRDDKRIDHLYTYKYLIENLDNTTFGLERDIYNIADAKYYRRDQKLKGHDVPKQFTYARNVIQWHMDLLHDLLDKDEVNAQKYNAINLFDKVTEGYNIIPNFFISGFVDDNYSYDEKGFKQSDLGNGEYAHGSYIFWERLFDRNTYFTLHYDVNFLYVLKLFAQNKASVKAAWKEEVRQRFRQEALDFINDKFVFYQIIIPDNDIELFVEKFFRKLIGKIFCFNDAVGNRVLLYAERKDQEKGNGKSFKYTDETCTHVVDDNTLYIPTAQGFDLYRVTKLNELGKSKYLNTNSHIEQIDRAIVGYFRDEDHLTWIMKYGIYNLPAVNRFKQNIKLKDERLFASCLILHNEELGNYVFNKVGTIRKVKKADLPQDAYAPTSFDEYYICNIDVNQKNDEVIEAFANSTLCQKELKKSPFTVSLSSLQQVAAKAIEEATLAKIAPIDALRYKLEDEEVFYSLVAEPEAEYGNQ